jgi:tetratricopeptide (TPR) repeat protein
MSHMKALVVGISLVGILFLDLGRAATDVTPSLLAEAKQKLTSKSYQAVVDLLTPALEKANREVYILLAKAYVGLSNGAMAQKTLALGLTKYPKDPELPTEMGRAFLQMNKDREAKTTLKEVLEKFPKYEPAFLAMAEVYERKKNFYELRLLYQDLLLAVGRKPIYVGKVCELATNEGLFELSNSHCSEAVRTNPTDASNFVHLARTYKDTGREPEAEAQFKKAATLFPKSELAQYSYAAYADEIKKYPAAFQFYKHCSEADAKSVRCWLGLGLSGIEVQNFTESIAAFTKLCEIDKDAEKKVRRAAGIVKNLKLDQWQRKYEALIDRCEKLTSSKSFL